LLVDMFDNIGTLIGVTRRSGIMDAQGNIPRVGRALVADSIAAIISSLVEYPPPLSATLKAPLGSRRADAPG
jgi:xanthine/uracil/vitamin C permease (AzgA family)